MPSLTVLLLVHGKVTSQVVSRYSGSLYHPVALGVVGCGGTVVDAQCLARVVPHVGGELPPLKQDTQVLMRASAQASASIVTIGTASNHLLVLSTIVNRYR